MISVGKYKVLHCISYLQLAGDDAHVDFEVFNDTANFRVRFVVAEGDSEKSKMTFASGVDPDAQDRGLLTFTNWNKKDFRATIEPVLVAIINDQNLYLLYAVTYDNGLYHVRLQFMEDVLEQAGGDTGNV